jgi:hypothetical protein
MAIRDDFAPGEVLAAADLNDTFASKPPFAYGTATPTTTVEGFIWYDENLTPPLVKFWDGSAFQTFSPGAANFSNSATGTYTDSGVSYKYVTFTGSGTLTVTRAGLADILIVGGGGGGHGSGSGGGGGANVFSGLEMLSVGSLSVVIGAGSSWNVNANPSTFNGRWLGGATTAASDSLGRGAGGMASTSGGNFGGGGAAGNPSGGTGGAGVVSSITGSSAEYGRGGNGTGSGHGGSSNAAGCGGNGDQSGSGLAGVVIIRVRT